MTTINVALPAIWQPEIQQQIYRSLLTAFSYPGRVQSLPIDHGKWDSLAASLATMVDGQVSFFIERDLQDEEFIRFMSGSQSSFVAADWIACDGLHEAPLETPKLGTLEEPELSATILLRVASLGNVSGDIFTLEGPGIKGQQEVRIEGLHPSWQDARASWCEKFPQGVDFIFCAGSDLVALPRTTHIVKDS